jgi:hypothetical protein
MAVVTNQNQESQFSLLKKWLVFKDSSKTKQVSIVYIVHVALCVGGQCKDKSQSMFWYYLDVISLPHDSSLDSNIFNYLKLLSLKMMSLHTLCVIWFLVRFCQGWWLYLELESIQW